MSAFCTTITSHERPVAIPPTIAKIGQGTPRHQRFGRARKASSARGSLARNRMIAACAIVNDSVAPNE
jgi:hypothetical protein